jgi:hypothetical protein
VNSIRFNFIRLTQEMNCFAFSASILLILFSQSIQDHEYKFLNFGVRTDEYSVLLFKQYILGQSSIEHHHEEQLVVGR